MCVHNRDKHIITSSTLLTNLKVV